MPAALLQLPAWLLLLLGGRSAKQRCPLPAEPPSPAASSPLSSLRPPCTLYDLLLCRYVTRKDPSSNAVYVSRHYHERAAASQGVRSSFAIGPPSWCSSVRPDPARPLFCKVRSSSPSDAEAKAVCGSGLAACQHAAHSCALLLLLDQPAGVPSLPPPTAAFPHPTSTYSQVRHGPHMYGCNLELAPDHGGGHIQLDASDQGLAAGQYAVLYQNGVCLGSAVIAGCDAY